MKMNRLLIAALFAVLAQVGLAFAQNPLVGEYLETQIGFLVTFQQDAAGQLTGTLQGSAGPMPLTIQADTQNVQGSFMMEGGVYGFAAQLQPDGQTLLVWLYSLNESGQPIESSYEQYTALRQEVVMLPVPPAAPEPVGPSIGGAKPGAGSAMPPVLPEAPVGTMPPPLPEAPVSTMPPPLPEASVNASQSIVGNWQGSLVLSGMNFVVSATYSADGTFREEVFLDGQTVGWYAGTWVLGADGALQQTSTGMSDQICIQGECAPNEVEPMAFSTVAWLDVDSFLLTDVPAPGETPTEVRMQRVTTQ